VVCCDAAYTYALEKGIKPDYVLGDFDSLGYIPENAEVFPKDKDYTDFELAVKLIDRLGIKKTSVYCGGGGREDHFLGNICVMNSAFSLGINMKLITDYSEMFIAENEINLNLPVGTVFSLIPLGGKVEVYSGTGVKYTVENIVLTNEKTLGISNEAVSGKVEIHLKSGRVLVVIVKNEIKK